MPRKRKRKYVCMYVCMYLFYQLESPVPQALAVPSEIFGLPNTTSLHLLRTCSPPLALANDPPTSSVWGFRVAQLSRCGSIRHKTGECKGRKGPQKCNANSPKNLPETLNPNPKPRTGECSPKPQALHLSEHARHEENNTPPGLAFNPQHPKAPEPYTAPLPSGAWRLWLKNRRGRGLDWVLWLWVWADFRAADNPIHLRPSATRVFLARSL